MKSLFIEARKKFSGFSIDEINLNTLPQQIFLAYSIQYKYVAEQLRKGLRERVKGFQQILGCSKLRSKYPILLIGSGRFHALQLSLQGNTLYILEGGKISKLNDKETAKLKMKRKAALSKFLTTDNIGILVSCKPGQENLKKALKLRKKLEKKGKKARIFLADNINTEELENYNIKSWVNTACPALSFDSRIINIHDIEI